MKAADRRRRTADLAKRRCPACRNRRLTWLRTVAWCEDCGESGPIEHFPYLGCYAPKEST